MIYIVTLLSGVKHYNLTYNTTHLTKTLHLLPCQPSNAYYKLIQKKYTFVQKQYSEILMHSSPVCLITPYLHVHNTVTDTCRTWFPIWTKSNVSITRHFHWHSRWHTGDECIRISDGVIKCTSLCYYLPRVYSLIIIILLHWKTGECMIYISKESRHSQTLSHNAHCEFSIYIQQ
jgi:hypothetical protein